MAKAKGIRVNQLAKELGIGSKLILDRCKTEGLGDKVPNHMSLMSLGLAETVREWFAGAGGGTATAVETATADESAAEETAATEDKHKSHARKKKTGEDEPAVDHEGEDAEDSVESDEPEHHHPGHHHAEPVEHAPAEVKAAEPLPVAPAVVSEKPAAALVASSTPAVELPAEHPVAVAPIATLPAEAPVAQAPKPVEVHPPVARHVAEPPVALIAPPVATAIAPEAPAVPSLVTHVASVTPVAPPAEIPPAVAVAAASAASAHAHGKGTGGGPGDHGRQSRPTVTLANRGPEHRQHPVTPPPQHKPERKVITPAPQLVIPAPAKIQGPRIVREEQPDVVSAPRRRGPINAPATGAAFVQARPQGGRGVKAKDDETEEAAEAKKKAKSRTLSSRRRGPDGRRGEALEKLREWTEADLIERRDRLNAAASYRAGFDNDLRKKSERGQHSGPKPAPQRGESVEIEEPVTVKSLSAALGVKTNDLLVRLMKRGTMANVNQSLSSEVAIMLAMEFGIELEVRQEATLEEQLERELDQNRVDAPERVSRPPVVTILGHVDHGKTSLLDKIRSANVAAGESGGITQHTAAWMVQLGEKRVTFIDTPGHQAFTSMRARGANMTDVVVLVVSAAEGVQPQTIESINHARAAGVPIVVAMNKIDRPDSNEQQVLGQLAAQGLNPVEWGGDTEVIRTSAVTGQGIPELIEILDYQSQLLELTADPTAPARGTVIEACMNEGLGAVATVLVQDGTLKVGDIILSGPGYGRIRNLLNDRGEMIQEAGPATPVIVAGLDALPAAGDKFYIVDDMERARSIAEERATQARQTQLSGQNRVTADNLFANIKADKVKTINLIIKGDVQGSVETLSKTVTDQNTEEVKVKVIHAAVGGINESDVELAAATTDEISSTVIIGFHVVPDESARILAEQRHVEIRLYRVIYEIFDDLKKALSGMLTPEVREKLHGHTEIRQVFKVSRVGNIAGCMVVDGHIQRGSKIRLIRNSAVLVEDLTLESLKRMKDDVKEVKAGFECGLKIAGYDDIKVGDRLEAYSREFIHRTL